MPKLTEEAQVQALSLLMLARHHLNLGADSMAQAHDLVNAKGSKAAVKLLQRAYDKVEAAVNERCSDKARAKFGIAMAELESRERGYDDSQEEGAGVSRPDTEGREEGAEGQDGRPPSGLGGDRTDAGAGEGSGEAPAGDTTEASEREGEG